MDYKSACKLASMILKASGRHVRVDEFYARRGSTIQQSAILSEFNKFQLVEFLNEALQTSASPDIDKKLVEDFINGTVQETIENDFIVS